jgi:hypothetical protein
VTEDQGLISIDIDSVKKNLKKLNKKDIKKNSTNTKILENIGFISELSPFVITEELLNAKPDLLPRLLEHIVKSVHTIEDKVELNLRCSRGPPLPSILEDDSNQVDHISASKTSGEINEGYFGNLQIQSPKAYTFKSKKIQVKVAKADGEQGKGRGGESSIVQIK